MITLAQNRGETLETITNDVLVVQTFQNFHLSPYAVFVTLDLLFGNDLQCYFYGHATIFRILARRL